MARSDFFRNMPPELAEGMEALSRLQYELRETQKQVLAPYDAANAADVARRIVDGVLPRDAGFDAVKAAVLENEHAVMRSRLGAAIEGRTVDSASTHDRIVEHIDAHQSKDFPGGAVRRYDALELLRIDGAAFVLRIADLGMWAIEWQLEGGSPQALLRLPGENTIWQRDNDGKWFPVPSGQTDANDIETLVDALLRERGDASA